MYRINLYPELEERRRLAKTGLLQTILLTVTSGLGIILIILITMSGFLLRERVVASRAEIRQMETRVSTESAPNDGAETAAEMMLIRTRRIDWSPKLAALAAGIPPSLKLQNLSANATERKRKASLEISGVILGSGADLGSVIAYVDDLKRDPRVTRDFSAVSLGSLGGSGQDLFHIVCEPARKDS
jgi:hypothetical protein